MHGADKCILTDNAEFVKFDVVQEHIDATQIVGGQVDLLSKKSALDIVLTKNFFDLQQQRTAAAGRIVHLVDAGFSDGAQTGEQLGNIGRGKILTALLTRVSGIHTHEVFVGIAEQVRVDTVSCKQWHPGNAVQQFRKDFISLGYGLTDGFSVHIEIIKQTGEIIFRIAAGGTAFDMGKDTLQSLVEIFVLVRTGEDIAEQLRGQNKETLFLHQTLAGGLCFCIRHLSVIKVGVSRRVFACVYVSGKILRNIAVEHSTKDIGLKIPLGHMTSVNEIGRDFIYGAEQFFPLLVFFQISHCLFPPLRA